MDRCVAMRALRELKGVDTLVYEQARDSFVPTMPVDRGMWQNWVKSMRKMLASIDAGLRVVDAYANGDRITGEPRVSGGIAGEPAGERQASEGWKHGYTGPGR